LSAQIEEIHPGAKPLAHGEDSAISAYGLADRPDERQDWSMPPRLPSLVDPPILFAHRGARAHVAENTIEAFSLAVTLGATGLESDVWVTSDGVAVLDHDGVVGPFLRRRPIAETARQDLPSHIPSLAQLYDVCGTEIPLSLDIKDANALDAVLLAASDAGDSARERLWLCHPDWQRLAEWRKKTDGIRLVDSTRLTKIKEGPERRAAQLSNAGVDAINLHFSDWTGGLTTLFHRFSLNTLGWDAQHERMIRELVHMGIDGLYSDHVNRMVNVARSDGLMS